MKMESLSILIIFCLFPIGCLTQTFVTEPVEYPGKDKIIVEAMDGEDVSVYCSINDSIIQTVWQEVDGAVIDFDLDTGMGLDPYMFLSIADDITTRANLSIPTFTIEQDRLELYCRPLDEDADRKIFLFGIPAAPVLVEASDNYTANETEIFFLDLFGISPFPPYVISRWTLDNENISDSAIILGDYNISIDPVDRNFSGKIFRLTVSNGFGMDNSNFTLNVQYAPEGDKQEALTQYASIGDNVTIIAITNLDGNPYPTNGWDIDGKFLPLTGRFSSSADGSLKIKNVQAEDFGEYSFYASNQIGEDIRAVGNTLIEAVKPGAPMNINVNEDEISDVKATVSWEAPNIIGKPSLSHYILSLEPYGIKVETSDNSTYLEVTGLYPATTYKGTMTAISSFFPDGGNQSTPFEFTTEIGAPKIDNVTVTSEDGKLKIETTLKYTGGINRSEVFIDVDCGRPEIINMTDDTGSGRRTESCDNCLNESLMVSLSVGPVYAGATYACLITASSDAGMDFYPVRDVISDTGIPSLPSVIVTAGDGSVTLTIRTANAGVPPGNSSLKFNIKVINKSNEFVHDKNYSFPEYVSDTSITIIVADLEPGDYTIIVAAINEYGSSPSSDQVLFTVPLPSSTTTVPPSSSVSMSPTPTESTDPSSDNTAAIIGGAVGGGLIVFVIVAVVVIVVVFYLVYKKKRTGRGNIKVKPEKKDKDDDQ